MPTAPRLDESLVRRTRSTSGSSPDCGPTAGSRCRLWRIRWASPGATVYTRVENMLAAGVITGFSAQVDSRKVGFGICTLVFVTVRPQTWGSFRKRVSEMRCPDFLGLAIH
jgi:hypothetical protein